jgi:hypothetical protein
MARNLDATRSATTEALEELRNRPSQPPVDDPRRTIEDARPADLLKLRESGGGRRW